MARVTFAPFKRSSAVRASAARSPSAGPRRPSLTPPTLYRSEPAHRLASRAPAEPRQRPAQANPSERLGSTGAPSVLTLEPVPTVAHTAPPTFMDPAKAGETLRAQVDGRSPMTVADAAAKTGLALRDAESGLKWLSTEYRGQLRVTAEGQLVPLFPSGFTKPWEGRDASRRGMKAFGRGLMGVLRFVVLSWVAIVLVGYAAILVALILAMTFARQGNDSRRSDGLPGGVLAYAFFRVLGDALFWTFHPWSPFSVYSASGWGGGGDEARRFAPPRAEGPPGPARRSSRAPASGPRRHSRRQGPHRPGRRDARHRAAARRGRSDDGAPHARLRRRGRRQRRRGHLLQLSGLAKDGGRYGRVASQRPRAASGRLGPRAEAAPAAHGQLGGRQRRHRRAQCVQPVHGLLGDRQRADARAGHAPLRPRAAARVRHRRSHRARRRAARVLGAALRRAHRPRGRATVQAPRRGRRAREARGPARGARAGALEAADD